MKMNKRISMLLASTMALSMLASCGSSDGGSSDSGVDANVASIPQEVSENPVSFPLDSAKEYTFHYHARNQYVFDPSWPVFQEMTSLTNISLVNTANPVATNSEEQIQLQAIDKFPSDLYGGNNTAPYYMLYGPQGAFYALDDYWEYLPNFLSYLNDNPDVAATIVAEDGKIYHIPYIAEGGVARTYHIRQDWLDNLGLETPETVEDLEAVLVAFRDDDPNGNGLKDEIPYFNDKWNEMIRLVNLWDARCYATDTYAERVCVDENGEMYHAWTADEFKTGIENVSRWYDEGLIDQEVFTKGNSSRKEYIPGDIGGMTHEWVASTSSYNDTVTIDGFNFVTFAPPITATGNQWEEHQRIKVKPDGWAISVNCDEPEELFAFMDYFYSEEGRILSNFGVEGVHYTMENGKPIFTDLVLKNDKAANSYLEEDVGAQLKHGYWQDYEYEWQWTNEIGQAGVAMYTEADYAGNVIIMPELNYTSSELATYEELITPINSYLDEIIMTWVIEDWTKIDGQWDDHLARMDTLGVDELLANYQSAYDRYMSLQ